jgi:hypothetical protein
LLGTFGEVRTGNFDGAQQLIANFTPFCLFHTSRSSAVRKEQLQLIELNLLEDRGFAIINIGGAFDSVSSCIAPHQCAITTKFTPLEKAHC